MPNRILKEQICASDDIDRLKPSEEVFFYRLIVKCDDFGRFDARPKFLKSALFPIKNGVTVKNVEDSLQALVSVGLVVLYEVEGKPFLFLPTWERHQQRRANKSKFPPPSESDINGYQLQSDVPVLENRESLLENREPKGESSDRFAQFWSAYPKKKSKGQAEKAWEKLKPNDSLFKTIMGTLAVAVKSADWLKDSGQYIPYPATWLNAKGWEDEYDVPTAQKSEQPRREYLGEDENGNAIWRDSNG